MNATTTDHTDLPNGHRVTFTGLDHEMTVVRTLKDRWGNAFGQLLVTDDGTEYELREVNGDLVLTDAGEAVLRPTRVGAVRDLGVNESFRYVAGGYELD